MSYNDLANGSYRLRVSLTLTDGRRATAARRFSVRASGQIYWTDSDRGAIGRSSLQGLGAVRDFITPVDGRGIAVNRGYVYWADGPAIGRARLDGSNANRNFIVRDGLSPAGIAVDRQHLYWANRDGRIGRANLNGSGVEPDFITGLSNAACGLAVDSGSIYWTTSATIGRANLDGSNADTNFIATGGNDANPIGCSVAVNGRYLYWPAPYQGMIGRANLDGSNVNVNYLPVPFPVAVAVTDDDIYWVNRSPFSSSFGEIGRQRLDGSRGERDLVHAFPTPAFGIAASVDRVCPGWRSANNASLTTRGRASLRDTIGR